MFDSADVSPFCLAFLLALAFGAFFYNLLTKRLYQSDQGRSGQIQIGLVTFIFTIAVCCVAAGLFSFIMR